MISRVIPSTRQIWRHSTLQLSVVKFIPIMAQEADTFVQAICDTDMNDTSSWAKFRLAHCNGKIKSNCLGKDDVCEYWMTAVPELVMSKGMASFSKYKFSADATTFQIYAWCLGQLQFDLLDESSLMRKEDPDLIPCGYYVLYEKLTGNNTVPKEDIFWLVPIDMVEHDRYDDVGEDTHFNLPHGSMLFSEELENRPCYRIKGEEILRGSNEKSMLFGERRGCYRIQRLMVPEGTVM